MPVIKRKIQRERAIRDAPKRTQWWLQAAKLNTMPKNNSVRKDNAASKDNSVLEDAALSDDRK